jgi:hypothetical protein
MEDHNGEILLDDREGGGARVSLVFKGATVRDKSAVAASESSRQTLKGGVAPAGAPAHDDSPAAAHAPATMAKGA